MRLGDFDALKKELNSRVFQGDYTTTLLLSSFNDLIDNAPTVEAKTTHDVSSAYDKGFITAMKAYGRPQGEWKSLGFAPSRGYAWCTCSNCGKTTKIYLDKDNDFCCIADIRNKAVACLFCGADMRKDGAE